jgi:hypothetical protein
MPAVTPDNTAIIGSVDVIRALLFGPPQHDAHMQAFRCRRTLDRLREQGDAGCLAIEEMQAEWREAAAQRVANDYDHNTASIRAALHRWQAGCFSTEAYRDIRANRIRELTRALDIAIEWQGAAAVAAE